MTIHKISRKWIGQVLGLFVLNLVLLMGSVNGSQAQGNPPSILKIEFPAQVHGSAQGKVHFRDPDGDLHEAIFGLVDGGGFANFKVTPNVANVAGVLEGSFDFVVQCGPFAQRRTLKLTLIDQARNKSAPAAFTFDCWEVLPSNYDEEQETVRPINTKVTLNFFVLEDEGYELAEGANFASPTAILGEPSEPVRRAVQEAALPDLIGIWDQCGIGFELGVVWVIRPRNVTLRGGGTLESIFTQTPDIGVRRLEEAIPILNEALRSANAREIQEDDRNLFLVNLRPAAGFFGFGQQPGRIILQRWFSIYVDPISNEVFKPKRHIKSMAHELGHNFGLPHSSRNLMDYSDLVGLLVNLSPQQCEIVEQNVSLPPL